MTISNLLCLFIIAIILLTLSNDEGFRSQKEKDILATRIISNGEPNMDKFRNLGLGGVEYYDSKKLWNRNRFTKRMLASVL